MGFRTTFVVVLVLVTAALRAEEPEETVEQHLARIHQQNAIRFRATSRSAPHPASQPIPTIKMLRLKEGSPPAVQQWFTMLPQLKVESAAELTDRVASLNKELAQLRRESLPTVSVPNPFGTGAGSRTDPAAAAQRLSDCRAMEKTIASLRTRIRKLKDDPAYWETPSLRPAVGSFGHAESLTVKHISGPVDMQAGAFGGDVEVWVHGVSTANLVDGHVISPPLPFMITGTKKNFESTMFLLEQVDPTPYVEVFDADPSDPTIYAKPKPVIRNPVTTP